MALGCVFLLDIHTWTLHTSPLITRPLSGSNDQGMLCKQTVLTKASGNSRQDRLDVNGFLIGFEVGNNFRVSPVNGYCFYFPASIYSCKQQNRCNQTVPTKKSQDPPRIVL